MRKRYGEPQNESALAATIGSSLNILSVLFSQAYFPTLGNGLKDLASYLGFKWSAPEPSGRNSVVWRMTWENDLTPDLRRRILTYNLEDCRALAIVAQVAGAICTGRAVERQPNGISPIVVHTELQPHQGLWGHFKSPVVGFEEVNKAAHWGYQRERVYARSSEQRRTLRNHKSVRHKMIARVNKTEYCLEKLCCPKCGQLGMQHLHETTKILFDLFFGNCSISRRKTNRFVIAVECARFRSGGTWCFA